jgi:hypothetical protein
MSPMPRPFPTGGLVGRERRCRYSGGIKMRIRCIKASEIKRGALITGATLLEATDALNIDNMEGTAAHRSPAGETILTLISDDNYSVLQRKLLMQFAIPEKGHCLASQCTVRRRGTVRFAPWRCPA